MEIMVVTLIITVMIGVTMSVFFSGQGSWFTSDAKIQLQESLRKALQRLAVELRQTQIAQQFIFDGTGPNSSDAIRFSIPVICHAGDSLLDSSTNVAHWGAPLTWGCASSTCMDADNVCATVEYKFLEYHLNNSQQLVRDVEDGSLVVKRTDVVADNILDLQIVRNGSVITITVQAQKKALNNRIMTAQASEQIYLRN
jgi:Tfp pilus assembly protein PilW